MIDLIKFHECLQKAGVEFITGVPDSLLNDFCLYVQNEYPRNSHVIAANEGNAIAMAAGYHLATGSIPLVYMQNSGLGNAMNPLLSLVDENVYAIPMVLLIGWRGEPGTGDWTQHKKQGELTPVFLESMGITFRIMDTDGEEAFDNIRWAVDHARNQSGPTALIAKKGVFAQGKKADFLKEPSQFPMRRENAIECILKCVPANTLFVASTGRTGRELHALRDIHETGHDKDILNVGAMGHASSIALGIALARKDRLVVCLDGDASALMHLGSLTTTGKLQPSNFVHVVLNNGVHESVGGQSSAAFTANLTAMAENAGYKTIGSAVETEQALRNSLEKLLVDGGPAFIDVHIRKGIRIDLPPLRISHEFLKGEFKKGQPLHI
jgi:phosphonopyruvate decarboxylase